MQYSAVLLAALVASVSASAIASPKTSYPTHKDKSARLLTRAPLWYAHVVMR